MLRGKHSRWALPIAVALTLVACGSGGGSNEEAANTPPGNDAPVAGQSSSDARFGQTSFDDASFALEASSARYDHDKFR